MNMLIPSRSEKLGQENQRLRENPPSEPTFTRYASSTERQTVGPLVEDEGSVVMAPTKPTSCGACRAKESRRWWKAPRGLHSKFLCDNCGLNWRKYGDLNVRPTREDSVQAQIRKVGEKREGSPLTLPGTKRAKVCLFSRSTLPPTDNHEDYRLCTVHTTTAPASAIEHSPDTV